MSGKLITALNDMPNASKSASNVLAACVSATDSITNKISVGDILDTRVPDPSVSMENRLIGTPTTRGEKLITVSAGTGINISGGSISANLATALSPGVVRVSGSELNISAGVLSLNQQEISHSSIGGIVSDEHVNHGNVYLYGGSHITINSGSSNTLKTNSTIAVTTVSSPSSNKIPTCDSSGYLERFVRETIYMKVVPETEPVEAGKKVQFFLPGALLGKKIVAIGLGSYTTSASGNTINVIFRKTGYSTLVTGTLSPSSSFNELTVSGTVPSTGGKAEFYITSGNSNVKGLDAWITVIKQ